ncbi:uncharacterized protein K452DRAFT_297511 [Aplosporella prunicola CBS 121167]|uniref:Uncharacterized protein n=1 Tax=Aplosporella prunicola CBS 121167 TaxID=1176127 RepID=A0A6A6BFR7_9PEZI|nr:uncharacterized protein K452DRAFT_297511 [Aplosporella prunicola CBS 121167]KAF2142999.1 hypothetical protein K452DRAFT_297511 [Aplosporella prunicola CBS 121167]
MARFLLDRGANPHTTDFTHTRILKPVAVAAQLGHLAIVKLLLKRGADPNHHFKKYARSTALQLAASRGHVGVVHALLDAGADMYCAESPLRMAAERGQVDAARALLERGYDVQRGGGGVADAEGELGREAVFVACVGGHVSMVRLLAQWGVRYQGEVCLA